MRNEEFHIQTSLVLWLGMSYPNVLFTISPNGMKLPLTVAKKIKAMGYKAGTPDLIILEPRKGYNGLFIELKTKTGELRKIQKEFIKDLNDRGYKAVCCYGFDEAMEVIEEYFK